MGVDFAETPTKIREVERTDFSVRLRRDDLPWLPESYHDVSLVRMRIGGSDFLFGSAIQGKRLRDVASKLDPHRSEITNNLLRTHLPQFAEGFNPHVRTLDSAITRQPIFYVGNKGGQRVYFMRFGKMDNMPVIVRIAACDKTDQVSVYKVITSGSKKFIKAGL